MIIFLSIFMLGLIILTVWEIYQAHKMGFVRTLIETIVITVIILINGLLTPILYRLLSNLSGIREHNSSTEYQFLVISMMITLTIAIAAGFYLLFYLKTKMLGLILKESVVLSVCSFVIALLNVFVVFEYVFFLLNYVFIDVSIAHKFYVAWITMVTRYPIFKRLQEVNMFYKLFVKYWHFPYITG